MKALQTAFSCLSKPVTLLSPFTFSHHLGHCLLQFLLLPSPNLVEACAPPFLTLLHFLSLTERQFTEEVLQLSAEPTAAQTEALVRCALRQKPHSHFFARPTLLLRVITPTGFSVVVRALVDSGASITSCSSELASLLLSNGASIRYTWPYSKKLFNGYEQLFCRLVGLKLQSVEDESIQVQPTFVEIEENKPFAVEYTPMDLVTSKMASFGIQMIKKPLNRTMWGSDQAEPNSQFCVHMIIGQDLINEHILMQPRQPTYHISPFLSIVRTKMGLTFSGRFKVERFAKWKLSRRQTKKMKNILYPSEAALNRNNFIISIIFCLNLIVFLPCALLLAFLLQSLITTLFVRHCKHPLLFLHRFLLAGYTAYLQRLYRVVESVCWRHLGFMVNFLIHLGGFSFGQHLLRLDVRPCLPLIVSNGSQEKTVVALFDSGSGRSYISHRLVEELQIVPEKEKYFPVQFRKTNSPGYFYTAFLELHETLFSTSDSIEYTTVPSWVADFLKDIFLKDDILLSTSTDHWDLLIGTDLLTSFFFPKFGSPKVISLAPNLCALETDVGYYLQGYQHGNCALIKNWLRYNPTSARSVSTALSSLHICWVIKRSGPSRYYCPSSDVGGPKRTVDKDGRLSEDGEADGDLQLFHQPVADVGPARAGIKMGDYRFLL
ncbi:hypothetical protein TYRP_010438 [Tyrophagus putrescentiae]|nr:hypothetical protein TYRP_010438 [Tyrophagus putrescentiae]